MTIFLFNSHGLYSDIFNAVNYESSMRVAGWFTLKFTNSQFIVYVLFSSVIV